jgi:D-beta-D-heptose 7-phosphate kinase/D-beta-D-heptose 1-phosphate adenosyltransferase
MLDRYVWGRASRISEEAPVPVVFVERETVTPGGAANVARNILSLGGNAAVFGYVGVDEYGTRLRERLGSAGADLRGVQSADSRGTTVKTRVLAGNQQVVRIDREDTSEASTDLSDALVQGVAAAMQEGLVQAVIVEDYAKGAVSETVASRVVAAGQEHDVFVALDPHPSHPFNVKGFRLMTPNRAEAFALTGTYYQPGQLPLASDAALREVGTKLHQNWGVDLLLVTLGGDGMALFAAGKEPVHIPTRAREVFDVSGAGDTVMASFVLGLLAGGTPGEAAELANHAAGIVVAKVGTATVSADELRADLRANHG